MARLQGIKPNLGPNTWKNDAARVRNHLVPALGSFTLAQLTPEDVEAFTRAKLAAGLSSQTVLHLRALLRRSLNRALRHGLVLRNVAALADPPKLVKTHEQQFLDVAEARAFLAAIKGDQLEALWVLALTTGLRRGEQLALHWRDVDLTVRTYHVTGTLQRVEGELRVLEPKTTASRATGQLAQLAVEALLAHRQRQISAGIHALPSAFIFTTRTGRPIEPRNVNRSFERLLKRHDLKRIRLHDLRHSIGSLMLANGESPRVVMEVLRHSQIAMTMNVYSHVMPAVTREAMDRLDALLRVPAR
jgi:integrase